ncbi:MAG: ribosome maturation factor RimM [Cyanobacteriota bacterium ELA615]
MNDNLLKIGEIVAAQGIKGEVKVYPDSDFPERFTKKGLRYLRAKDGQDIREIELLQGRIVPGKNLYILTFSGINDRNTAEDLRGYEVLVDSADLPQLAQDEYHVSQLLDLEVYNQQDGNSLGKVVDIIFAGQDILEVKPIQGANYLIPFVKEIVPVVDLVNKKIEINPPKGLLEITKNNYSQ